MNFYLASTLIDDLWDSFFEDTSRFAVEMANAIDIFESEIVSELTKDVNSKMNRIRSLVENKSDADLLVNTDVLAKTVEDFRYTQNLLGKANYLIAKFRDMN